MAITLSDNLAIETAAPVDVRYGPWEGTSISLAKVAANAGIDSGLKFKSLTVGLLDTSVATNYVVEYWYQLDTSTPPVLELVEKTSGGTVGGTGTIGRLPRWGTTTALDNSSINETNQGFVEVIKVGGASPADSVLYMDTTNRTVGFRTNSPGAAFDVNGSMRVRSEINVGHTSEQNLFVQGFTNAGGEPIAGKGFVKMGSYGEGLINGYPTANASDNLRMASGFAASGKVVDNYIYDTFEITIAALESLGTTPLTGEVLVDTPSNLTCLLADFWFYRKITADSNIGTWNGVTDLVIYPSNDLTGQTIASPYEQGYFRVSNDFLKTSAVNGRVAASSAIYQGNINGIDQGGMNGAWQIGINSNDQPLGNKVYLSLNSNGTAPTFPADTQTRFFIGLKYRFLSLEFGVIGNENLIVIGMGVKYSKCAEATGGTCASMPSIIGLPTGSASFVIVKDTNTNNECCYIAEDTALQITPDMQITGTYTACTEAGIEETVCAPASATTDHYVQCESATTRACNNMANPVYIAFSAGNPAFAILEDGATGEVCCYVKQEDPSSESPTTNYSVVSSFSNCDELPDDCQ
tara:strand:+ start:292 stop:2031 length:1740 start_codon:yes stop_codon:yes gene_type:complete